MPTSLVPAVAHAPEPPPRFRGRFISDPAHTMRMGEASGPFRRIPLAVARPIDTEDVGTLVAWAAREGVPLVPRGGGTGMPGGNVGEGVVVDLAGLDHLGEVDDDTGEVVVGPGVTGAALDAAARRVGRFFPALPSSAERCMVGGMVANNAAGARSFGYGAVAAWVAGLDLVLADGMRARLYGAAAPPSFATLHATLVDHLGSRPTEWPDVRKNASGYALDRFLPTGDPRDLVVGSEGTLGIVTGATLRTAPLPEHRAVVLLPLPELDALDTVTVEARAVGAAACEFFGRRFLDIAGLRGDPLAGPIVAGHSALVLLEVGGVRAEVEDALARLGALARRLDVASRVGRTDEEREHIWALRHAASPVVAARAADGLVSMQFIEDSVVPSAALTSYLRGLDSILTAEETDAVVFGHAGDGNTHVNPLVDVGRPDWRERVARILEQTVDLVASLGGTLSGEHGDGRLRAPFQERIFGQRQAEAFRTVKRTLDPQDILNPGVVVPLEGQDPLAGLTPHRRVG